MSILCDLDLPVYQELLANPVLNSYTLFKKVRPQTIESPHDYGKYNLHIYTYSLPIFVNEIGAMVGLDMTSRSIWRDFEDKKDNFLSYYSENEVLTSKFYNFDQSLNRVVSWGNYCFHKIEDKFYNVYLKALVTDLTITPCVFEFDSACCPLRWFRISSVEPFVFKATVNYNTGIIYVKREDLECAREILLWVGRKIKGFQVRCGFLEIGKSGFINCKQSSVVFLELPKIEDISDAGNYFGVSLISLNEYKTSCHLQIWPGSSINIVDTIFPLVYSKYDILPRLFPCYVDVNSLSEPVLSFNVPTSVFYRILSRLQKFGGPQNSKLIESFDSISEESNPLVKIEKNQDNYKVKFVNPALIYSYIKTYIMGEPLRKKHAGIVLENTHNLLAELENPNMLKLSLDLAKAGFSWTSEQRINNFGRYASIYNKLCDF